MDGIKIHVDHATTMTTSVKFEMTFNKDEIAAGLTPAKALRVWATITEEEV